MDIRRDGQSGFTVTEVTVLVGVMAIIVAVTFSFMYDSVTQYNLSYDANQIANNLKLARMRAVFLEKDLNFTFANGTYGISPDDPAAPRQPLPGVTFTPAVGQIPTLILSGVGTVSQDLNLRLSNRRNQSVTISIKKSGQIEVSPVVKN